MQALYAQKSYTKDEDLIIQLQNSMHHMYKLYLLLLSLLIKLQQRAIDHQQKAKKKHLITEQDSNPNMRFVHNILLVKLSEDTALKSELEAHKIDHWLEESFTYKFEREFFFKINSPLSSRFV